MEISKQNTLELLAPAGSIQSFFAAIENGADAIFCGLEQFSARAKAKNFSLQELELIKGYAKEKGVKVYVALNTLIKEQELAAIIELLATLEYLQIDGVIIQDLGLYGLVHTHFPGIPLHASTQMLSHNLAGVLMLERMGFSRVVLARELTLQEITHIHTNSTIEIEHFIHGAMCYSMSGHCLFSSYIDGRSGNRGRCIQPCRRRYHHEGDTGFHFSTSDFSAIELIPDLIQAGVSSFKIEGRMKSAEYIAAVVASYRMVIDAEPSNRKGVINAAQETLTNAMGRSTSHGFLKGINNKNLVLVKQKGGLGKIIGRVQRIQKNFISFTADDVLHVGDRVRAQPASDRAGHGFTVRALKVKNRGVKRAQKGAFVTIQLPNTIRVGSGDLVFKLSTGKSFTTSEEACRRRLSNAPLRTHSVQINIECGDEVLFVTASVGGLQVKKVYKVEMFEALRSPLTITTLQKVFSKTTNPVLRLATLTAPDLPPVVIKPSRLKEIRRDLYKLLFTEFQAEQKQINRVNLSGIKEKIKQKKGRTVLRDEGEKIFVISDTIQDVGAVTDYTNIAFVFPLNNMMFAEVLKQNIEPQSITWDLPSIVFDRDWLTLERNVVNAMNAGFRQFRLNSLSHFLFFEDFQEGKLLAGSWLYCLNTQTMETTKKQNIQRWSLSIEDDQTNIERLLRGVKRNNLIITVYSSVDLFTSRIQPSVPKHEFILKNDKGGLLSLSQENGMTITQSEKAFSLTGKLHFLRKMGCMNYLLDLRGEGLLSERGQEVLQAFYEDRSLAGTTLFNFERGLT
jgi:U32 family peptidase